jgi:allantoinase
MPWDLLIRGGGVVGGSLPAPLDIAIEDGVIVELEHELRDNARDTIDATGCHILPGAIDPHVHFNEPGRTDWEGFATGSAAFAAGGGTCFFDMPLNASPPTLDGESFDLKLAAAKAHSLTDFALWGGLTPGNLDRLEELAERGVIGFKAFMSSSGIDDFARVDDIALLRGMEIASKLKLPVAVHAESEALTSHLAAEAISAGRTGVRDYLNSRPIVAEVEAIRRAIAFAQASGCSLHIVHISSAEGAAEVNDGRERWGEFNKSRQVDVTGETCAHYLALTDLDVEHLGALAKCAPPLRSAAHVRALWEHVRGAGGIDFVTSDHSPAPLSMKSSNDFFKVWGGIAGIQSTLAVLLSVDDPLPLDRVADLIAVNAARRFDLPQKGDLLVDRDADLSIVDLNGSYVLTRDMLFDRHKLSPYIGRKFHGVVKRTFVRGHTVFRDGKIVAGNFRGKLVTPDRDGACRDA